MTSSYPPPLSSPPTVETLERLLVGLGRPLERGVPAAPVVDLTDDVLFGADDTADDDGEEDDGDEVGNATAAAPPTVAAAVRSPSPSLTWSAHRGRARRGGVGALTPTAGVVATTAAAALVAALAAGVLVP